MSKAQTRRDDGDDGGGGGDGVGGVATSRTAMIAVARLLARSRACLLARSLAGCCKSLTARQLLLAARRRHCLSLKFWCLHLAVAAAAAVAAAMLGAFHTH